MLYKQGTAKTINIIQGLQDISTFAVIEGL